MSSMTSDEYLDWCHAVSNTNKAMSELIEHRIKNYKWMKQHLTEFFEDLGSVFSVTTCNDGSVWRIRMNGKVNLDAEAFNSLPFNFEVQLEENDLTFFLYPDVEVYQD